MMKKNKLFQQINFKLPIGLWVNFEEVWLKEKNKRQDKRLRKQDLLVEIFRKGIENWNKRAFFKNR